MDIKLGADFEVFVVDGNNKLVGADLLLPNATKKTPIIYRNHVITHDRKSLECSIPPFLYSNDNLQFYNKINESIIILKEFLSSINPNYKIVFKDSIKLERNHCWIKGYELNVYKEVINNPLITNNIVTNGLHIHFSGIEDYTKLIKRLDKTIGIYYKFRFFNSERKDYGKLGSYRPKKYSLFEEGFEYRTLGGSMLNPLDLKIISILLNKTLKTIL